MPNFFLLALAFFCALIALVSPASAAPLEGAWSARTGWHCGGAKCEANDLVTGSKYPNIEAIWFQSSSARVCGVWHSYSNKLYRGLLIGSRVGNRVQAAYSQEIDHNSEFGKVKHFADAPKITTEDFVVLELSPKLASLYRFTAVGKPNGNLALSRVNRSVNPWGPESDWEKEFMSECLAGSNPSIEQMRNDVPPLRPTGSARK